MPATVRESQERMLAMLRGDNQDNRRQLQEQRMQKKYRMVRFFGMPLCTLQFPLPAFFIFIFLRHVHAHVLEVVFLLGFSFWENF